MIKGLYRNIYYKNKEDILNVIKGYKDIKWKNHMIFLCFQFGDN